MGGVKNGELDRNRDNVNLKIESSSKTGKKYQFLENSHTHSVLKPTCRARSQSSFCS